MGHVTDNEAKAYSLRALDSDQAVENVITSKGVADPNLVTLNPDYLGVIGLLKGKFTTPEDFDAPLPEELLRLFEGA